MGLPSLQALVGGGGGRLCFCHTFFRGGLRTTLGGGFDFRGVGGCSFFVSQVVFYWNFYDIGLTNCNFKLQVCHAMLCSVVVCCGLVRCQVVSYSVVCCGVLRSAIVCDLLVVCRTVQGGGGSVLWSHDMPCGVLCCHVVRSGVMWCGVVSCGVVWCGVLG